MTIYRYATTAEDPSILVDWRDFTNTAYDLSSGTFALLLAPQEDPSDLTYTKSSGFTGYASLQGTAPNRYNLVVQWTAGELATVGAGTFVGRLQHTLSSRLKEFPGELIVVVEAVPT